jgi:hypothetical protein
MATSGTELNEQALPTMYTKRCPKCGARMEPGFITGSSAHHMWTSPKWEPNGPVYSKLHAMKTGMSPMYPWKDRLGADPIPLSYRCTACWIYWLGPDDPDRSQSTSPG